MTKIRFSGFPEGAQVTLSALKGGVSRGPLTVSAWKQAASSDITFQVFSLHGNGASGPLGGKEIAEGDLIEMVAPGGLSLYIDNVENAALSDARRLHFETDFGERYDAEFLTHSHLPSDVIAAGGTLDNTGAQMGVYPGYVCGHAFRGTDMSGNQQLTADYNADAGPIGTCDRTVTVTVDDGVNSGSMSFTVRLVHPERYYTDTGGDTYATGDGGNRRGIVYVSTGTDFTGAPTGANIYHATVSDGVIYSDSFYGSVPANMTVTDTSDGSSVTTWGWTSGMFRTMAVFFKGGETFYPQSQEVPGTYNSMFGSWGTGRAIFSGVNLQTWASGNGSVMFNVTDANRSGWRFDNIDFHMSDYDVSDQTWREWWNILKYSSKSGTISGNSQNVFSSGWNGTVLTDGAGYTQVIQDDGVDTLLVRQIVNNSNIDTSSATETTFAAGATLEDVNNASNTVTLTATTAEWRQDRPNKTPAACIAIKRDLAGGDAENVLIDRCIIRGARTAISDTHQWTTLSDTLIRDYWDYGVQGYESECNVHNAVVVVQPSSYRGVARYTGAANSSLKNLFNAVREDDFSEPMLNVPSHSPMRLDKQTAFAQYKTVVHATGGHTLNANLHAPSMRFISNPSGSLQNYSYMHGCVYSGGGYIKATSLAPNNDTCRAWVFSECWLRGDYNTSYGADRSLIEVGPTGIAFKDCKIGWPSAVTDMAVATGDLSFIDFQDYTLTEDPAGAKDSFVENCTLEYQASGVMHTNLTGLDTSHANGAVVSYSGNTFDIDETQFGNVSAFQ